MKCVHCGFPLSPTQPVCRRCGMPVQGASNAVARPSADIPMQQPFRTNAPQAGVEVQSQDWNAQQASPFRQQTPTPQAAFPSVVPSRKNTDDHAHEQLFLTPQASLQSTPEPALYFPQAPQERGIIKKRAVPFGFTLSAICMITGALMLIFVYFMSLSVLHGPTNGAISQGTAATKTPVVQPTAVPTSVPVTPTPVNPGQMYADHVVMASSISTATAQPLIPATSFRVGQKIYVTFEVHPTNHSGGICLLWYLNNKQFAPFAFSVTSSSPAYSYTYANVVGAGYVEIYWSDQASCDDGNKMLAQRADFTVTG